MVCTDVETEPVLQEITGEELNRGANKAPDARLDVHVRASNSNMFAVHFKDCFSGTNELCRMFHVVQFISLCMGLPGRSVAPL